MNKPAMLVPALIGGVFLGVTSALPVVEYLNCACCMLVIGGGVLAAYFYLKEYPSDLPPASYGDGALLGLLTGLIGGLVWNLVAISLLFVKVRLGIEIEEMADLEEALSNPEIPEAARAVLEGLFTQGPMSPGLILVSAIVYFLASTVFATLGGILGVAIFQKKRPPAAPSAPVQVEGEGTPST